MSLMSSLTRTYRFPAAILALTYNVSSPSVAPCLVLKISWPPSRLSRGRRAEHRGASAERRSVYIKTCPTAAVDTPLNQAQCRDSVDLVGDLRPEVFLGCLDGY